MAIIIPIIAKFVDEGLEAAKKSIGEAEGAWAKTGATMEALNAPAKAVTTAMLGAGVAVAKNAGGALKANKMLQASFDAVGYSENAAAAMAYADSLQHVIGVSDEEIQATMQKLAAFESVAASQDMMARSTKAAADMASAGFGTMDSAAVALGKAMENPERGMMALTRMGVTFNESQRETVKRLNETGNAAAAQEIILKEVEGTFGGVAEASASGTNKMKLAWDEAAEALGSTLVPLLGIVTETLRRMAVFAEENAAVVRALGIAITVLSAAIVAVNIGMKVYQAAMVVAKVATLAWGLAMKVAGGPIYWIIGIVTLLAVVIIKNWDKIKAVTSAVWGWIKGFLEGIWNGLKSACKAAFDWIKNVVQKCWNLIKIILQLNPFIFVLTHLEEIKKWMDKGMNAVRDIADKVWGKVKDVFITNPFDKVKGYLADIKSWFTTAFEDIKALVDRVMGSVKASIDKIKSLASQARDAVNKIKPGKSAPSGSAAAALALPVTARMVNGVPVPQAAAATTSRSSGGGLTINVNGALDPERVARQIRDLLDSHDRRQGRTVLRAVAF